MVFIFHHYVFSKMNNSKYSLRLRLMYLLLNCKNIHCLGNFKWYSCPPLWYFLTPRCGCPSASPFHSGPACAWTQHQPTWRTSPPDGSPGWSCVCQPLLHASVLLLPLPGAESSGWRCPRPGPGSWELAFHLGAGTLLGLEPQQSVWQRLDLNEVK